MLAAFLAMRSSRLGFSSAIVQVKLMMQARQPGSSVSLILIQEGSQLPLTLTLL